MKKVEHQLLHKDFFKPEWNVKHLFLGTFNPKDGQQVPYFYARERNRFWDLLNELTKADLNPHDGNIFLQKLNKLGLACMDMIKTLNVPEIRLEEVNGKGYKDSKIINTCIEREYNLKSINEVIHKNKGVKVYSTWGEGPKLNEWKNIINNELIVKPIKLASPSMAARVPKGEKKFDYMLSDWEKHIKI